MTSLFITIERSLIISYICDIIDLSKFMGE